VPYLLCEGVEISQSIEAFPGITVEFGDAGDILGVEILRDPKVLTKKVIASLHAKQAGVL
jgi:uncharacterized protein YuzE